MAVGIGDVDEVVAEWVPDPGLPSTVLAVSDLHLGQGQDPDTGRYCRHENFFSDAAFEDFVAAHDPASTLLVLNGDTFDFLRVTKTPKTGEDLDWSAVLERLGAQQSAETLQRVCSRPHRFGLGTRDYKSVWKLLVVARGHPVFFRTLRRWVELGGAIAFVKGNHDLELYWPLVQRAIRELIGATAPEAASRVRFYQGAFRLGNLYFEHGHRFEHATTVYGGPLLDGGSKLRLPFGSLVNRHVVNKLDGLELFFSNIKPTTRLLQSLAKHHPFKLSRILVQAFLALPRTVRALCANALQAWLFWAAVVVWLVALVALVVAPVRNLLGLRVGSLVGGIDVFIVVVPVLLALGSFLLSKRRYPVGDDALAYRLFKILSAEQPAPRFRRPYGVLGHSHVADIQVLSAPEGGPVIWYVNTGTWAPRFEEERPDLMGRVVHSVVRFRLVGDEYEHECIEWTPLPGAYKPAMLYEMSCGN